MGCVSEVMRTVIINNHKKYGRLTSWEALLVNKSAVRYFQHSPAEKPKKRVGEQPREYGKEPQPLTSWRANNIVSRLETQQGTTVTHLLESQGQTLSARYKHSKAPQPLTCWRFKDRHCQQARNTARYYSHSQTEEPRTGIVSRLETQQGTTATHQLKSQGQAVSAG